MKHIVVSRLNIHMARHDNPVRDDSWLNSRMEEWRKWFVPGLEQTEPPDLWVMLIDPSTPQAIRDEIESVGMLCVESDGSFTEPLRPLLESDTVTTRVDSDDRIAPDFCERVHRWAEHAEVGDMHNFPKGYKVANGEVYAVERKHIGFHSYKGAECVYDRGEHSALCRTHDIVYDPNPAWVTSVHDNNHSKIKGTYSSKVQRSDGQPLKLYPSWVAPPQEQVVDFYAGARHYIDHLAPLYLALPSRGRFITRLVDYAQSLGIDAVDERGASNLHRPTVIASIGQHRHAKKFGEPRILTAHGAGMMPRQFKAVRRERASGIDLILWTPHSADEMRELYSCEVVGVGCPKLDKYHGRTFQRNEKPVVAFSHHLDNRAVPETTSAFPWSQKAIEAVVASGKYEVLIHKHPGDSRDIEGWAKRIGCQFITDFGEVLETADIYVCDNSSTLYEFAATDRPVVVLSPPQYRRGVAHGLRFWEHLPGVECSTPDHLSACIEEALADLPERQKLRRAAVEHCYGRLDGRATERAVRVVEDWLAHSV